MRDAISLIANSGLQFYRFQVRIDPSAMRSAKFRFVEQFDITRMRYWLDEVLLIDSAHHPLKSLDNKTYHQCWLMDFVYNPFFTTEYSGPYHYWINIFGNS